MPARLGEYQGRPVLSLVRSETDRYPFSFGPAKARLIVENMEIIKKFADKFAPAVANPPKDGAAVDLPEYAIRNPINMP